jgi:glucokinase
LVTENVVLGVDVGGTNVKAGLVMEDGTIVTTMSWPTESEKGFLYFSRTLYQHMQEMASLANLPVGNLQAVGIGLPGFLDLENGILKRAVNLKWPLDVPVTGTLQEVFGVPVCMDNDGNLAALGEVWIGAGTGSKSALCVTIGTGVGGGIVLDGHVYRGVSTMAGEIGHLPMKPDGELCNCGKRGCLETLASATALARMGERAGLKSFEGADSPVTAKDVFRHVNQGNPIAREIVNQMVDWLARGLAQAANLLNPDVIVIGGGVVQAGEALFNPLVQAFAQMALPLVADSCKLVSAKLGTHAGMLGAARLGWQHGFKNA